MPDFEPHISVEETEKKHNLIFVDLNTDGKKLYPIKNDKGEIVGYKAYIAMYHTIQVMKKRNESGTEVLPDQGDFDNATEAFKSGFFGSLIATPTVE